MGAINYGDVYQDTATIAAGAALSSVINANGLGLAGIAMPAAWTAAKVTVFGSMTSGGSYVAVIDTSGAKATFTVGATDMMIVPDTAPVSRFPFPYMKLRSDDGTSAVNQTAGAVITVFLRKP